MIKLFQTTVAISAQDPNPAKYDTAERILQRWTVTWIHRWSHLQQQSNQSSNDRRCSRWSHLQQQEQQQRNSSKQQQVRQLQNQWPHPATSQWDSRCSGTGRPGGTDAISAPSTGECGITLGPLRRHHPRKASNGTSWERESWTTMHAPNGNIGWRRRRSRLR